MKLESDLSCHPRLSGARSRVINNSSLTARAGQAAPAECLELSSALQDNSSSAAHAASRDPLSASPGPDTPSFIIETASHSRAQIPVEEINLGKGYKYCSVRRFSVRIGSVL